MAAPEDIPIKFLQLFRMLQSIIILFASTFTFNASTNSSWLILQADPILPIVPAFKIHKSCLKLFISNSCFRCGRFSKLAMMLYLLSDIVRDILIILKFLENELLKHSPKPEEAPVITTAFFLFITQYLRIIIIFVITYNSF